MDSANANLSRFAFISSEIFTSMAERFDAAVSLHAGKAVSAACTAFSTSRSSESGIRL